MSVCGTMSLRLDRSDPAQRMTSSLTLQLSSGSAWLMSAQYAQAGIQLPHITCVITITTTNPVSQWRDR